MEINLALKLTDRQFGTLLSWMMKKDVVESLTMYDEKWKTLKRKIDTSDLYFRSISCLRAANIQTYFDLVCNTKDDMFKYKNVGGRTVADIERHLQRIGLRFGMIAEDGSVIEQSGEDARAGGNGEGGLQTAANRPSDETAPCP